MGSFQVTAIPEKIEPTQPTNEQLLVTIGSFSTPIVYVVIVIILISLVLILSAFKLGRRYSKLQIALAKGDNVKMLLSLKKHLEKYLEILQNTRHSRILSKEEKDIKEAIEVDLDEVDRAIEEQNRILLKEEQDRSDAL
jgi:biotin-(acetyl-CoA carboxylase) ligase